MHQYYHLDAVTDLAVIREQANARTKPNNKWCRDPEETVIHMHLHAETCSPLIQHEFYAVPPLTPEEVARAFWAARHYAGIVTEETK
jgi:hypothetical protein